MFRTILNEKWKREMITYPHSVLVKQIVIKLVNFVITPTSFRVLYNMRDGWYSWRWSFKPWSSGLWHRLVTWLDVNVSEDPAVSIFRVKEDAQSS